MSEVASQVFFPMLWGCGVRARCGVCNKGCLGQAAGGGTVARGAGKPPPPWLCFPAFGTLLVVRILVVYPPGS